MSKQWEHLLHTTVDKAEADLAALTPPRGAKTAFEASRTAALGLVKAAGDGPVEIYLAGKPGVFAFVKVAARGDEPES